MSVKYDLDCVYYLYGAPGSENDSQNFYELRAPCIYYYPGLELYASRELYGLPKDTNLWTVGELNLSKEIRVVAPAKPAIDVSVVGDVKYGETNNLRVLVKNNGDVNVSLKGVISKPGGELVSCDSDTLKPGQEAECLLSVTPQVGRGLSVEVSYGYSSCGKDQVGLVTKTLVDSTVINPSSTEQAYSMQVHTGCENSYYACNDAKAQPKLFAGYKCYKTGDGTYYTPATERFNLRFDLSSLPKGVDIQSARLNMVSSNIGKPQTVSVYSLDKDWSSVKCVPGGDICSQPYCGECAGVYNLSGTLQSSLDVSTPAEYSFDVTNLVKDKYAAGQQVSLQVRGQEGLWEKDGQSTCLLSNAWDKRDVSFNGDSIYLEVVYR